MSRLLTFLGRRFIVPFLSNASTLGVQAQDSPDLFTGVEQNVRMLDPREDISDQKCSGLVAA